MKTDKFKVYKTKNTCIKFLVSIESLFMSNLMSMDKYKMYTLILEYTGHYTCTSYRKFNDSVIKCTLMEKYHKIRGKLN